MPLAAVWPNVAVSVTAVPKVAVLAFAETATVVGAADRLKVLEPVSAPYLLSPA